MFRLHCCVGFSLVAESGGSSLTAMLGSLVAEHGLQGARASAAVAQGLSCFPACGKFPDQGLNHCSAHPALQADSLPLSHQGSPGKRFQKSWSIRVGEVL